MSTNVNETKFRYGRWLMVALAVVPITAWYLAVPGVAVNFSHEGKEKYRYIWNTQHRIYKGEMPIGGGASIELGNIFPNEDFFMRFDWWSEESAQRCIDITPKRGRTMDIYLDAAGRIDTTLMDADAVGRLKPCAGEPDPFRL